MKKQLFISIFILLFGLPLIRAQVTTDDRSMSQGNHTAFMVDIPQTNDKFVENIWKKYLKSYSGKSKKNRGTQEIYTSGAKISKIGKGKSVDLYTIFEQSGDDVLLSMWVDLGDEFLSKSSKNSQVDGAKNFLEDFANEVRREIIRLMVKEEDDKLDKLEVSLKRLVRDSIRFEREIEMAEEKILKNTEKLEENRLAKENMLHTIDVQRITLDSIKSLQHN